MQLSTSVEDYLKAIYKHQTEKKGASTSCISEAMNVSAASATNMVKKLATMDLVEYQSYRGAKLTESGQKIALEIIRHHRLLELYLLEVMGYSWDEVHDEAEKLEHHISERFESKIAALLNNPSHDPHGDPIPTKEGVLPKLDAIPLPEVAEDQTVIITRVEDQNSERLRYLEEEGLLPGLKIVVKEDKPFNGPITLQIEEEKKVIGREIASSILVSPLSD